MWSNVQKSLGQNFELNSEQSCSQLMKVYGLAFEKVEWGTDEENSLGEVHFSPAKDTCEANCDNFSWQIRTQRGLESWTHL